MVESEVSERERQVVLSLYQQNLRDHSEVIKSLEGLEQDILLLCQRIEMTLNAGAKILIAGNGGSASDAQHFAAELTGCFEVKGRRGLAGLSLNTDTSALTSIANDLGFAQIFARQLEALASPNDLFIGISTSGNSANIVEAIRYANEHKIEAWALSGRGGGDLNSLLCDKNIVVGSQNTARIQEAHIVLIHHICNYLDQQFKG